MYVGLFLKCVLVAVPLIVSGEMFGGNYSTVVAFVEYFILKYARNMKNNYQHQDWRHCIYSLQFIRVFYNWQS